MQSVIDWIARNKILVGLITGLGGLWMYTWGCPGAEAYCEKLSQVAAVVGSFLFGGGAMNSDKRAKFEQVKEEKGTEVAKQSIGEGNNGPQK